MTQAPAHEDILRSLRARLRLDAGLGMDYIAGGDEILHAIGRLTETAAAAHVPAAANAAPSSRAPDQPSARSSTHERSAARPSERMRARPDVSAPSRAPAPARSSASGRVSLVPYVPLPANAEKEALLAALRKESESCSLCGLCEKRNSVVWGEGSLDADVLFIGEAPGRDENLEARPFVGRSGRLLTDIIEKGMQIPRGGVYITNVVKCRPPGNRDPRPDETAACSVYLKKQIEVIAPSVIVAVGTVAARALLGLPESKKGAPGLRGRWHEYEGIPLRVLFHPSYLLRLRRFEEDRTEADRETWGEVREVLRKIAEIKT